MNTNRATVGSVVLTLLLVTSTFPLGLVDTASADPGVDWYTVRQSGGICHEVQSFPANHPKMQPHVRVMGSNVEGQVTGPYEDPGWNGPVTIESIMDYRYRDEDKGQTGYYAPYLNAQYRYEPWEYGTYGLWNWSVNGESHMFFYENANGEVSLVLRHDKLDDTTPIGSHAPYNGRFGDTYRGFMHGDQSGNGQATFSFENLPQGEWAYIDDMYPREDMDDEYYDASGVRYGHREAEYESQPLREFTGGDFRVEWVWGNGGTDGGAYRGMERLEGDEQVVIDPSFGNIDRWAIRHNDGSVGESRFSSAEDGRMLDLQMDRPVIIQEGRQCLNAGLSASPDSVEGNGTVTFTAGEGGQEYAWDFDGDGTPDRTTSSNRVTHQYNATGTMEASVTITGSGGQTVSASTELTVEASEPPTASLSVAEGSGASDPDHHVVGEQLVFNASASADNTGGLQDEVVWEFGDGTNATGDQIVTHRYEEAGEYTVTATVTDELGNTDTVQQTVVVETPDTEDPEASLDVSPTEFEAGQSVTLDASESDDERGIAEYRWDVNGDGEYDTSGQTDNITVEPPYRANGSYDVSVQVVDPSGNTDNASVSLAVTPAEDPTTPNVTVDGDTPNGASVTAGDQFELAAESSDNVGVTAYGWDFDADGAVDKRTEAAEITHEYETTGTQRITVVAYDEANHSSSRTITVQVAAGPVAAISANATDVNTSETVRFDASESNAEGSNITEYRWDFDGDDEVDETSEEPVQKHSYGEGGEFNASVTIVTERGNEDTATTSVVVTERQGIGDGDDEEEERGGSIGGSTGGGGAAGPPPVVTDVETVDENAALVDVQNGRDDESVRAALPRSAVANETGVAFTNLVVDLGGDDAHVAFETAASADAPAQRSAPSAPDETLSYLDVSGKYLDQPVESSRVIFAVQKGTLGETYAPQDLSLYHYDNGSWSRLNTTVARDLGDSYRLKATSEGVGTFAVGATQSLSVGDTALGATTATQGERVEATASVTNDGPTDRTLTVNLTFDGQSVAAKSLTVPAGETKTVTLAADVGEPGSYDVAVEGVAAGTLVVEEKQPPKPADVSTRSVSLNASTITVGEYVEITATVENSGEKAGTQEVALTMFGEQVATKTVKVPGGETKTVTFVQRVDSPGEYTVKVGGEQASLSVAAEDDGPATPSVPGFGVGTAVVALVAAALLARRDDS